MSKQSTSTSRVRTIGSRMLLATFALSPLAAPLAAQNVRVRDEGEPQITVQNNRDEAVTIYLDDGPFELKLGTVEPMRMATLSLPWTVRGKETIKLLIQPKGDIGLLAQAEVTDEVPRLGLVLPEDDEPTLLLLGEQVTMSGSMVTVKNDRDEPADVFILHGSHEHRLGRVAGESTQTFNVPDHDWGEAGQIMLVPEGGLALLSRNVSLVDAHIDVEID